MLIPFCGRIVLLIGETKFDGFFLLLLDDLGWVTFDFGDGAVFGFGGVDPFGAVLLLEDFAFLSVGDSTLIEGFNILIDGAGLVENSELGGIGLTCAVGNLGPLTPLENGVIFSSEC